MVSKGLNWSPEWHCDDIFEPSSTNNIGTRECYSYRKKIFERHPYLANTLYRHYLQIYNEKSLREANLFIGRIDKGLNIHDINLSDSNEQLKIHSERLSRKCRFVVVDYGETQTAYDICRNIAKKYTIEIDAFDADSPFIPTLNKLSCNKWWYRKLNTIRLRKVEQVNRALGVINKETSCYASNFALEHRQTQLKNSYEYLSNNRIINDEGQEFSLLDVYSKSVSNPRIRKAELMTRIRGFEEVATMMGHAGEFYTLTAPSKYHRYSNGKFNPKFNNSTPKEVNEYFNGYWKLIRSALQKKNIHPYGFRVVEPHHDGTPHWHLLLFMHPDDVKSSRATFEQYALREDGNERGAKEHRFKAVSINAEKGSAAGYIAKYISKNIDGADIEEDLYGNESKISASKIDAWCSTWGIRQFQQIGGPSVTVWRELRRLRESDSPEVVQAFRSADSGDWAGYVLAMGGPILPRSNRPIHPFYENKPSEVIDTETGEITLSNLTYYGEVKPKSLTGLISKNIVDKTRTRKWRKLISPMTFCDPKYEGSDTELAALLPRLEALG